MPAETASLAGATADVESLQLADQNEQTAFFVFMQTVEEQALFRAAHQGRLRIADAGMSGMYCSGLQYSTITIARYTSNVPQMMLDIGCYLSLRITVFVPTAALLRIAHVVLPWRSGRRPADGLLRYASAPVFNLRHGAGGWKGSRHRSPQSF